MSRLFPHPRTGAIAGFLSAVCFVPGFLMLPKIMQALELTALDQGLAQIGTHGAFAIVCQSLWILSDIGGIIVAFSLAGLAPPGRRRLIVTGTALTAASYLTDMLVGVFVITAALLVAPAARADVAMHAAGIAKLRIAATLDGLESYPSLVGTIGVSIAAWSYRLWPRWLVALGVVLVVPAIPGLAHVVTFPFPVTYYATNVLGTFSTICLSVVLWRRSTGIAGGRQTVSYDMPSSRQPSLESQLHEPRSS